MLKYICKMPTSPLRFVLALVCGVFVAYCVTLFFQTYAPSIIGYETLKEGADFKVFEDYLANLPLKAAIVIVLTAALGAFSGGYTATRVTIAKKKEAALGVGIFCTVIAVFMMIAFSYPIGLAISICAMLIPFAYFGGRFAGFK